MIISRDNTNYNVIKYSHETNEVCVECEFDYATPPRKRKLKLWWKMKYCKIISL